MHYTLCDMLADLTQNAVEAASSEITIEIDETEDALTAYIRDNGKGMDSETLKKAENPFYTDGEKHPQRKTGMGIPFLIQTAETTDGEWNITSQKGEGTTVYMRFDLKNIDTPPIGSIPLFFRQAFTFEKNYEMTIIRKKNTENIHLQYALKRSEIADALGGFETASQLSLLGDFLKSQEEIE
ncbi:MAG: sensor histidine kinase [Bacteroides sp.]|nr:sensor histidine kinase [Prevotella sp.]MCM1408077.1 sensor histidine kinase [Treponema brennaborense]MCM1469053.1 sensor histidine kinase [Bacteroides sp.]